jgi:LacI family transcriptional regulator
VIAVVRENNPNDPAARFGKPVVNISSVCHPVPFPTVTVDNELVGKMAAEHLMLQGYQYFAYHVDSRTYNSRARLAGFQKTLAAKGKSCGVFDIAVAGSDERLSVAERQALLRRESAKWITQLRKPLGLFTHNDVRAAMIEDICQEAGFVVPDQIGVMGADNDELAFAFCSPPLTSIDMAGDLIGYRAAEVLVGIIENRIAPPSAPILIAPRRVVERASTQPQFGDDELLAQAVAFIRQHATKPISIDDVLDAVPLSRRSLERRFRERLGRSPGEEIRRIQLEVAKQLLIDTDQTLARITQRSGYRQFRNFASAFRRETGLSPSDYRKRFRTP